MGRKDFTWNAKEGPPLDVIEALEATHGHVSVPELIGAAVLEMASAFDQLRHRYTTLEQRHQIADMVRERFLQLQGMVSRIGDADMRSRLTHYLVQIGSLSNGESLLEAIARRHVRRWVDGFYKAAHNIDGEQVNWELFDEMQRGQAELLHWLDS